MKILVDMNLSPRWVDYLVASGFEALHWSQIGARDAPDAEVMQWAVDNSAVVLTRDLDFGAILATSRGRYPSVIQIRSDVLTPKSIGEILLAALRYSRLELSDGALFRSMRPVRDCVYCRSKRATEVRAIRLSMEHEAHLGLSREPLWA